MTTGSWTHEPDVRPAQSPCVGTNEAGIVDSNGELVTEFTCNIALEIDGRLGCCFGSGTGINRFFECTEGN